MTYKTCLRRRPLTGGRIDLMIANRSSGLDFETVDTINATITSRGVVGNNNADATATTVFESPHRCR